MDIKRSGSQPSGKGPADWFHRQRSGSTPLNDSARARARRHGAGHFRARRQDGVVHTPIRSARRWWSRQAAVGSSARAAPSRRSDPATSSEFEPGEKHWHGVPAPTTAMSHIAIQEKLNGSPVDWMEHVSDEQFGR